MKKIPVLLAIIAMGQLVNAQEKVTTEPGLKKERMSGKKDPHMMKRHDRREMMKQLNLTDEQKAKMREMKEANKGKKEAILNDSKLTEEQKHAQLKEMHEARKEKLQSILTDEQKQKMKELKEKKRLERKKLKSDKPGGIKETGPATQSK